jgi:hypothetical protein
MLPLGVESPSDPDATQPNLTANLTGQIFISTNVINGPYDLTAFFTPM